MRVLKSVFVGVLAAIIASVLAYLLGQSSNIFVEFFIAPAQLLLPIIGSVIPTRLVYSLTPDGGALAGVLLVVACAFLFWSVVFGGIHFFGLGVGEGFLVNKKQKPPAFAGGSS